MRCFGFQSIIFTSPFLPHLLPLPPPPPPPLLLCPLSLMTTENDAIFSTMTCYKITCQSVSLSPLLPSRGRPQDQKSGHSTSCLIFYLFVVAVCVCVCVCVYVCMYVCMYIYMCVRVCVCVRVHPCVCVCVGGGGGGARACTQEYVHRSLCVCEHSAVSVH